MSRWCVSAIFMICVGNFHQNFMISWFVTVVVCDFHDLIFRGPVLSKEKNVEKIKKHTKNVARIKNVTKLLHIWLFVLWLHTNLTVRQSFWLYICMMPGLSYHCMPNLEYMCVGLSKCLSLTSQLTRAVKSHSGAQGNILVGPPNIFTRPLWGENFWIFLFNMVHYGVLYISGWRQGPPNIAGSGIANPYPTLLMGLQLKGMSDERQNHPTKICHVSCKNRPILSADKNTRFCRPR